MSVHANAYYYAQLRVPVPACACDLGGRGLAISPRALAGGVPQPQAVPYYQQRTTQVRRIHALWHAEEVMVHLHLVAQHLHPLTVSGLLRAVC